MNIEPSSKSIDALLFLFNSLPTINKNHLEKALSTVEFGRQGSTANVEIVTQDSGKTFLSHLKFGNHSLQLVGFNAPVPENVVGKTIVPSHWKEEQKEPLLSHQSHMICLYEGANLNPVEQQIALYKTASTFIDEGLLGTLDEKAWNCMPTSMIKNMVEPNSLAEFREAIPVGLWTGFVKFFRPDGKVWFGTKGHERFSVPNFTFLGMSDQANTAFDLFTNLFHYVRNYSAALDVGHTAEMGDLHLKFDGVSEYHDYLESSKTLVVEMR